MHSVDSLDVSTWWAHVLMNMPNFCVLGTVAERGIWDDVICQHAGREADTHVRHKCKSDKKNENHTVQKPFKCLSLSLSLLISILLCSSEIKNRILHVCKHRVSCKSKTEREYQICEQSSSCDLCTVCFQANKQNAARAETLLLSRWMSTTLFLKQKQEQYYWLQHFWTKQTSAGGKWGHRLFHIICNAQCAFLNLESRKGTYSRRTCKTTEAGLPSSFTWCLSMQ